MKLGRRVHYWSIILCTTFIISLFFPAAQVVWAQLGLDQAQVSSVSGSVEFYSKNRPGIRSFLKSKDQLEPGRIETDKYSKVVITLGDGSVITIMPNSRVMLKEFPVPGSARELLEILFGQVKVKIKRAGGKPNPYRLNSPSASIAVRGTEFVVDVLQSGETSVSVQEGLVEVWARSNPENKRLVTPGGNVIVRPGGDISLAFPGPGGELNGRNRINRGWGGDLEGDYRRSVDSLVQNSINILPSVFTAFPDSHLDSLDNPAYAAEFKDAEGRLSVLPSVSNPFEIADESPRQLDYSISPQLTFYTPIPGTRLTVGGSVSALRTRMQNLYSYEYSNGFSYNNKNLRFDASNFSITTAYSIGSSGRTSVGIGIDKLSGTGSYLGEYRTTSDDYTSGELRNSYVRFTRTRLTVGLFHKFSESKNLGVYYRQGFNSLNDRGYYHSDSSGIEIVYPDHSSKVPGYSNSLVDKTDISTLSYEIGFRYRAQMTRRLFYGIEGSYLYERIKTRYLIEGQPPTRDRDLARRGRLGVGTGFILNSRTVLSLDFTAGRLNTSKPSADNIYYSRFGYLNSAFIYKPVLELGDFLSGQGMIQTNPWRNLFISASSLTTFYKGFVTYRYPDMPNTFQSNFKWKNYFTNIGTGWRFKPNLIGEYRLSLDHSNNRGPSHSLMLRYTFNLNIKGEK
jgi:hypothetical protein